MTSNFADAAAEQRVLGQLVEREVIMNMSCIISMAQQLSSSGGKTDYFDEDDTIEWFSPPVDKEEAIWQEGFDVVQLDDEDRSWAWHPREVRPYEGLPPEYSVYQARTADEPEAPLTWWFSVYGDTDWCDSANDEGFDSRELAEKAAWRHWLENEQELFDEKEEALDDCVERNDIDLEDHRREVYEHWAVTGYFARKLSAHGELVFDFCGVDVWGRQCTGQSILMDWVIKQIATEMEILPGMKYDWSER